jgi:predicted phosphohydrolase
LREIVKLSEFKRAKYRIAIQHIPSVGEYLAYRSKTDLHLSDVLKDANIDMALCGHLHRHCIFPKGSDARELYRTTEKLKAQLMRAVNAEDGKVHYPTVVNSHKEAMFVHISEENIKLEFFDMTGKKSQPDFVYKPSL